MSHDDALREGVERFNARLFWHAHESWERIWLEERGVDRRFFQGLIQLAAAYHHIQRGNWRGAARLFDKALERLSGFPAGHLGLDRSVAVAAAAGHREICASALGGVRIGTFGERDFPKLELHSDVTG